MDIRISQSYAQIGIERSPGGLDIQTRSAQLELRQKHAKINLHAELPKVKIDQYECFASAGLKNCLDRSREIAQRTYRQVMEFIGKTAEDGNRLAAIEKGGNPIAEIAVRDAYPEHEFGLDFLPKAAPKIEVTGNLQIDPERNSEGTHNGVEGTFTPGEVNIRYTPDKISIYLKQYGSINFEYTGNRLDAYI